MADRSESPERSRSRSRDRDHEHRRDRSDSRGRNEGRSYSRSPRRDDDYQDSTPRHRRDDYDSRSRSRSYSPRRRDDRDSDSRYDRDSRDSRDSRDRSESRDRYDDRGRDYDRDRSRSRSRSRNRSRGHGRNAARDRSESPLRGTKIVVERLSLNVDEDHIWEIFGQYGPILQVDLREAGHSCLHPISSTCEDVQLTREDHNVTQTAQILFERRADAQAAMCHMHGGEIDERIIAVSICLDSSMFSRVPIAGSSIFGDEGPVRHERLQHTSTNFTRPTGGRGDRRASRSESLDDRRSVDDDATGEDANGDAETTRAD